MTPEQMQLVRLSLAQATTDRLTVGREFYQRLFALAPELQSSFRGDIDTESAKLKDTLTLAFASLSDMEHLVATVEALARRGVGRELSDRHCRLIAQSLLYAIERRIGEAFTPQVCNAWIAFLAVVVSILRGPAQVVVPQVQPQRRVRAA
jgi:hemoglobin-like flavoprotein